MGHNIKTWDNMKACEIFYLVGMKQNMLHDFIIIDIWSLITVLKRNVSYKTGLVDEETKINN